MRLGKGQMRLEGRQMKLEENSFNLRKPNQFHFPWPFQRAFIAEERVTASSGALVVCETRKMTNLCKDTSTRFIYSANKSPFEPTKSLKDLFIYKQLIMFALVHSVR